MSMKPLHPGLIFKSSFSLEGTFGCFARRKDTPSDAVLIGCDHVFFSGATGVKDVDLYEPPFSASVSCASKKDLFATTFGKAGDGLRTAGKAYDLDCAYAFVKNDTFSFTNVIPGKNGVPVLSIDGQPAPGTTGVNKWRYGPDPFSTKKDPKFAADPFVKAMNPDDFYVRMFSAMNEVVLYGTIIDPDENDPSTVVFDTIVPLEASFHEPHPFVNQMWVLPRQLPGSKLEENPTPHLLFGQQGDSGSVVVNHKNEAIGILVGGFEPPQDSPLAIYPAWRAVKNLALVTPIARVLDHLKLEIPGPPAFARTAPASATVFYVPRAERTSLGQHAIKVRSQLSETRLGRLLIAAIERHSREASLIVNRIRHAKVAWHRHQGPAFEKYFLENARNAACSIPTVINGVDRDTLLNVMADVFVRYGSRRLRRDVELFRTILPHFAATTSLSELPALLDKARATRRAAPSRKKAHGLGVPT
jgi:hypothetical protein